VVRVRAPGDAALVTRYARAPRAWLRSRGRSRSGPSDGIGRTEVEFSTLPTWRRCGRGVRRPDVAAERSERLDRGAQGREVPHRGRAGIQSDMPTPEPRPRRSPIIAATHHASLSSGDKALRRTAGWHDRVQRSPGHRGQIREDLRAIRSAVRQPRLISRCRREPRRSTASPNEDKAVRIAAWHDAAVVGRPWPKSSRSSVVPATVPSENPCSPSHRRAAAAKTILFPSGARIEDVQERGLAGPLRRDGAQEPRVRQRCHRSPTVHRPCRCPREGRPGHLPGRA